MNKHLLQLILFVLTSLLASCGYFNAPPNLDVKVSTNNPNARIIVEDKEVGKGATIVALPRDKESTIFAKEGNKSGYATVSPIIDKAGFWESWIPLWWMFKPWTLDKDSVYIELE